MQKFALLAILAVALSGCVSAPTKKGDQSVYRLEHEVSWKAGTPLGIRTVWAPAGLYVAIFEDDEGVYLSPPDGRISTGVLGREEWFGGVYLPFDAARGINIYQGGGGEITVHVWSPVGILPVKVPDSYFRMRLWGPSELVTKFKKLEKESNPESLDDAKPSS